MTDLREAVARELVRIFNDERAVPSFGAAIRAQADYVIERVREAVVEARAARVLGINGHDEIVTRVLGGAP